jgi:non-specific serine/threonine protein kinase
MNSAWKQGKATYVNQDLQAVIMPVGSIRLEWADAEERTDKSRELLQREIFKRFSDDPDAAYLYLAFSNQSVPLSPSLVYLRGFCASFAKQLSHTPELETLRQKADVLVTDDELSHWLMVAPPMTGAEYLSREVLSIVWRSMLDSFRTEIREYKGSVEEFVHTYSPDVHLVGRVFFHLVENKKGEEPFAFLATYSTGLTRQGKSRHLPLKHALSEYGQDSGKLLELLATVQLASKESALIAGLLESGELFHPLAWSAKEAYAFLKEIPIYEKSGILCRIPNWWKAGASGPRVQVTLGNAAPSEVGMEALLSFDVGLYLEDTAMSPEEAQRLIESAEGLVLIKNQWVAVDPEKLKQTLEVYGRARALVKKEGISFRDALRFELNPQALLGETGGKESIIVSTGQWLESVTNRMRKPETAEPVKLGPSFKAKLRPYQERGVAWLSFLDSLRFGMCLADDMGLGKTVQVLALLHSRKGSGEKGASLLVVPASLLSNWQSELLRFAPDLKYFMAHPSGQDAGSVKPKDKGELDRLDLVITTYSMVRRYAWLHTYEWRHVILDEAQAIKNPGAKQTKAVKVLKAVNRIAMTGTPVENRLSDLWSLFDFLNPGLLGSAKEFAGFTKELAKDPEGYGRLRKVIGPYILRRLKTDKSVISDLPDKVEMKTWATLCKKQAILYQKKVDELRLLVESAEGIQRKGIILSALLKFKQICNHPDQYTGSGEYDESESGKFERLREICETIHEKRERALVFTQFREMTGPLHHFLAGIFERQGLVLHGGTAVGKRKELVDRFQGDDYVPYMVLSLKAGGVGLNLTAANHVVHFDRWWNPAVENQATDRAFRIGQKKNVLVHKFITKGTVEEKIDLMIEGKLKLSNEVIQSGSEAWITEMSNEQLMKVFTLTI